MIDLSTAMYVVAAILAIIAIWPWGTNYRLLNAAVVLMALGLVLDSGVIRGQSSVQGGRGTALQVDQQMSKGVLLMVGPDACPLPRGASWTQSSDQDGLGAIHSRETVLGSYFDELYSQYDGDGFYSGLQLDSVTRVRREPLARDKPFHDEDTGT